MLNSSMQVLVMEICDGFTSNETDEIVLEIVSEIYRLKGFASNEGKYQISNLLKEIENIKLQASELESQIGALEEEISDLQDTIESLKNE